jgi:cytochrome c biogenesis protein CcmG/thiol:disulfide interchange protein DsbE
MSGLAVSLAVLLVLGLSVLSGSVDGGSPVPNGEMYMVPTIDRHGAAEIRVGSLAPDFTLNDVHTNQPVSVRSLLGKPVLINFWGTWCPPCRAEMPEIQDLYARFKGEVQFVGISMGPRDEPAGVMQFIKQYKFTWTFLHDADSSVTTLYQVQGLPSTFFIDKDGVIRAIHVGGSDSATLESNLQRAIAQAPLPLGTISEQVPVPVGTDASGKVPVSTAVVIRDPLTPVPPSPGPTQGPAPRMPLEQFKKLYDDPATRPLIIDVRAKEAYDAGHIVGAISFPEGDVDTRVGELPKDKLVIAYCQ